MSTMKMKGTFFMSFMMAVFLLCNANAQLQEANGGTTIFYNYKKAMSAEDFFQARMKQSKVYKISGKKLEIFFEKNDTFFLGRNLLSGNERTTIKADTLYIISKENLMSYFPDYQLEGEEVREVVYKYLRENIPNFSGNMNSRFTYTLDKNILNVDYENITRRYIVKKSAVYHFKIHTGTLKILEFKKD